jgi:hypothetical protein
VGRCSYGGERRRGAGRAITVVAQYDVELYQRIEHMIGEKMADFPAPQVS